MWFIFVGIVSVALCIFRQPEWVLNFSFKFKLTFQGRGTFVGGLSVSLLMLESSDSNMVSEQY